MAAAAGTRRPWAGGTAQGFPPAPGTPLLKGHSADSSAARRDGAAANSLDLGRLLRPHPALPTPAKELRLVGHDTGDGARRPVPCFATRSLQHLERDTSPWGTKAGFRGAAGSELN